LCLALSVCSGYSALAIFTVHSSINRVVYHRCHPVREDTDTSQLSEHLGVSLCDRRMSLAFTKLSTLTSTFSIRQCALRQRWQVQSLATYTSDALYNTTTAQTIYKHGLFSGWSIPRLFIYSTTNEPSASLGLSMTTTYPGSITNHLEDVEENFTQEETKEVTDDGSANTILGLSIMMGNSSLLDLARLAISTLKRRKMKMNKHKLKKRRKLLRAKRDSRK